MGKAIIHINGAEYEIVGQYTGSGTERFRLWRVASGESSRTVHLAHREAQSCGPLSLRCRPSTS